jgi:hypothetical protein
LSKDADFRIVVEGFSTEKITSFSNFSLRRLSSAVIKAAEATCSSDGGTKTRSCQQGGFLLPASKAII